MTEEDPHPTVEISTEDDIPVDPQILEWESEHIQPPEEPS